MCVTEQNFSYCNWWYREGFYIPGLQAEAQDLKQLVCVRTYTCSVTNNGNCVKTITVTITSPPALTVTPTQQIFYVILLVLVLLI